MFFVFFVFVVFVVFMVLCILCIFGFPGILFLDHLRTGMCGSPQPMVDWSAECSGTPSAAQIQKRGGGRGDEPGGSRARTQTSVRPSKTLDEAVELPSVRRGRSRLAIPNDSQRILVIPSDS